MRGPGDNLAGVADRQLSDHPESALWTPQLVTPSRPLRYVSTFTGIGGVDIGFERAGMECVGMVEIDKNCRTVLDRRWPHIPKHDDIRTAITWADEQGLVGNVDLLAGGAPCFTADTQILTTEGYLPISEIVVGMLVLTHRGRWRQVVQVMNRTAPTTVTVTGYGVPGTVCTPEHPYWVRHVIGAPEPHRNHGTQSTVPEWRDGAAAHPSPDQGGPRLGTPSWVDAQAITGTYTGQVLPPIVDSDYPDDVWWLVGRILADGHLMPALPTAAACVTVRVDRSNPSFSETLERVSRVRTLIGRHRFNVRRVTRTHHVELVLATPWLVDLMRPLLRTRSVERTVSARELALPANKAAALLHGYITSRFAAATGNDLSTIPMSFRAHGPALAYGLALLTQRAFNVVSDVHRDTTSTGDEPSTQPQYTVTVPASVDPGAPTVQGTDGEPVGYGVPVTEARYGWRPVYTVTSADEPQVVFNIGVQDDESYIADGAIVHNCQDLSVAGQRKGFTDGERSVLYFDMVALAAHLGARWVVYENVPGLLTSNEGRDFAAALLALAEAGYSHVEWRVLDTQHFGPPQRRKRVFVVASTRTPRGREVLTEPEGGIGDPPASWATWPYAAGDPQHGVGTGRREPGSERGSERGLLADRGLVQAITASIGDGGPDDNHAQAGWLVPEVADAGPVVRPDGVHPDGPGEFVTATDRHGRATMLTDGTDGADAAW